MAKPDHQTDHGRLGRETNESALPNGEVESSDQEVGAPPTAGPAQEDAQNDSDADWGMSTKKEPMAKETKIGLALIVVLICAFAFVLHKRMQEKDDLMAGADGGSKTESKSESKSGDGKSNVKLVAAHSEKSGSSLSYDDPRNSAIGYGQDEPRRLVQGPPVATPMGNPDDEHNPANQGGGGNPFSSTAGANQNTTPSQADVAQFGSLDESQQQPGNADRTQNQSSNPFGRSETPTGNTGGQNGTFSAAANSEKGASPFGHDHNHDHGAVAGSETQHSGANSGTTQVFPGSQQADSSNHSAGYVDRHQGDQHQADGSNPPAYGRTENRTDGQFGNRAEGFPNTTNEQNDHRFHQHSEAGRETKQMEPLAGSGRRTTIDENTPPPYGRDANDRGYSANQQQTTNNDRKTGAWGQNNGSGSNRTALKGNNYDQGQPYGKTGNDIAGRSSFDGRATTNGVNPVGDNSLDRPTYYTVRPGDNYWTISRKTYGTARYFSALAQYNRRRIPDPRKMRPGMHVLTPSVKIMRSRFPTLFPKRTTIAGGGTPGGGVQQAGFFRDAAGDPHYRVGPGDTLSDIAQKHLGRASRWVQVQQMNKDRLRNTKTLTIGTQLRLPADASRIRLVRSRRQFR